MNRQLSEFLDELKTVQQVSDNTIDAYKRDIEKFLTFLVDNDLYMDEVDLDVCDEFIQTEVKSGISHRSCQRRVSSLNKFYKYLLINDVVSSNPWKDVPPMHVVNKLPDFLRYDDVRIILDRNALRRDKTWLRDQAMLELLFYTGVRVSELNHLDMTDLHVKERYVLINGKGGKQRIIPFTRECAHYLKMYLTEFRTKALTNTGNYTDKVFFNLNSANTLDKRETYTIVSNIDRLIHTNYQLHPHMFRHSFATAMLDRGIDIRMIQDFMGHSKLSTTQLYTHISLAKIKADYNRYHKSVDEIKKDIDKNFKPGVLLEGKRHHEPTKKDS